jgi:hypothetical protein
MLLTASSSAKLTVVGVWDDAVLMGGPSELGLTASMIRRALASCRYAAAEPGQFFGLMESSQK